MHSNNLCWIHLKNLKFFLYLGANPAEQMIGQNITLHLSIAFEYLNTQDKLENTLDYGKVFEYLQQEITNKTKIQLLEFLAEKILTGLNKNFPDIYSAKLRIEKGYVPLQNFTGSVEIEVEKKFKT